MAEKESQDIRLAIRDDLLAVFTGHYIQGRGVMMPGKAWLVSATA